MGGPLTIWQNALSLPDLDLGSNPLFSPGDEGASSERAPHIKESVIRRLCRVHLRLPS